MPPFSGVGIAHLMGGDDGDTRWKARKGLLEVLRIEGGARGIHEAIV